MTQRSAGPLAGFSEKQLQDGVFLAFLTGHEAGCLGWNKGVAGDISFMIDAKKIERDWFCRRDLAMFLQSPANASAWRLARRQFSSDEDAVERFIQDALLPKLMTSSNAIVLLRENIAFAGQSFCLWAPAPRAGDPAGSKEAFDGNVLRVVDELPFKRQFPASLPVSRRPDLAFFVNGLFLSYAELKNGFTGQSASAGGRKKISRELVEAAERALRDARKRHEDTGGKWVGWRNRGFPAQIKNEIRSAICLYAKAVHILAADAGKIFAITDTDWILEEVDDAIGKPDELSLLTEKIPAKIIEKFSELPEIHGLSASETVLSHLASYFHPADGVDKEIFFFNQPRKSRTTGNIEILLPRTAQRAMLHRTHLRVGELYAHEFTPKFSEQSIRDRLSQELPDLSPSAVAEAVKQSLMHLNGKDAHSILLQGSTGLGKTNLIVWIAQDLADMIDPASSGSAPLFDVTICLTDRTELRGNLGDEAERVKATRGAVVEAETFSELKKALENGKKIIVVNIQKFPTVAKEARADANFRALLATKRAAFVIDEAHRSQNGEYHEMTMDLFSDINQLDAGAAKRNLIICLTATPTDATLPRFGEWRAPKFAGDEIRWVPFFSYSLNRAVKDKVVLNPQAHVLPHSSHIQFNLVESVDAVSDGDGKKLRAPSSNEIYENEGRRKLVAEKAAKVYANRTILTIRPPNAGLVGQGKAMFVTTSVKNAIAYHKHIKDALVALSNDPKYADRKRVLAECPVLVLYSDKQGEPACASLNGGMSEQQVQDEFRRKGEHAKPQSLQIHNAIIIVVDKLLTGFDEPTLHTIFIDRAMDGVLLYQTASRVNRTSNWKKDCLVVDFSQDGSVSRNMPKVFAKYGGLTVSEFDAMPIVERMDEAYKLFFSSSELAPLFKRWLSESSANPVAAATSLSDALGKLSAACPDKAEALRKSGGAWRYAKDQLSGILDFSLPEISKHDNAERRAFADMVVRKLRQDALEAATSTGMIFDVDSVEASEGWSVTDLEGDLDVEEVEASPTKGKTPHVPPKTAKEILLESITAMIEGLQAKEDLKLEMRGKLQTFLDELFKLVDEATQADNSGYHRKRVIKMLAGAEDYPWDERQKKFRELLNSAVLQPRFVKTPAFKQNKELFLEAVLRKSDLVMADYEEWINRKGL